MAISLNQLKDYWKNLALAHNQVKSFSWGTNLDLTSDSSIEYPRVHVIPVSTNLALNAATHTLNVLCIDLVRIDDFEQLDEVWSDTQQILTDLKNHFVFQAPEWVSLDGNPTLTPVLEDYRDRFSGWQMSIVLQVDTDFGDCSLPFQNFTDPVCQ